MSADLQVALYVKRIMEAVESGIGINASDIELGAVELKNATNDTRAKIAAISTLLTSDAGMAVAAALLAGTNLIGKVGIDQVTANANEVVKKSVTPTLYNVTLTNADTEYSQALASCKGIEFQARTAVDIRFAFVTGKVATPTAPYMTLKSGQWYYFDGSPTTLYLASATAGTVVEIILWS